VNSQIVYNNIVLRLSRVQDLFYAFTYAICWVLEMMMLPIVATIISYR